MHYDIDLGSSVGRIFNEVDRMLISAGWFWFFGGIIGGIRVAMAKKFFKSDFEKPRFTFQATTHWSYVAMPGH